MGIMSGKNDNKPKHIHEIVKLIRTILVFAAFAWILDSVFDSLIFHEGLLSEQVFAPTYHEIGVRLLFVFILVIFGVYIQLNATKRMRAEDALREGERFLADIFASIQDGIGIIDKDMNIIHVNQTAEKWYPHAVPFEGKKCYEAFHGRSERCEKCPACKTLETGKSAYEVVPKHGQGAKEVGWLEIYSFPMIDTTTGRMRGVIEYVRDITDRKRAEEALKEAIVNAEMEKNKSKAIIDAIGDGIIIQDTDYKIIYQNQIQNELYGNHVGEYCYKVYEGRDTICEGCPVELVFSDGKIHRSERSVVTNKGILYFELTGSPLRDSTGKIIAGVKVVRNITEGKHAEKALKLFSEAVENAPDGVQITDMEGHIIYSNKSVEEIYGFSPEELKGKHVNEMNSDPEFASKVIIPCIKETGRWSGELMVRHKKGKIFPILLTTSIVKNGKGEPIAMVGIIHDITKRKQAEEEIRKYAGKLEESNRMKELFTDIMHHDLLNPLNISKGFVELLREDESAPVKIANMELIERNLTKCMELIESATMLSKLESLEHIEFEDMDLKDVIVKVTENLSSMADRYGMKIENNIVQSMPARANKIIEEVFANIISNAIKYAQEGKRIILDSEDEGRVWKIRVVDFGEGIPDAFKTAIFERFQWMEKKGVKGSGLGLAIAGKIMEFHKGRIWVEDNPEGGAIFIVEIPKSY